MSSEFSDSERPKLCRATVTYHGKLQFQDRLSYIDKRYDHLRKLTQTLKKKINELEDIMRQDNDEENLEQIRTLIEDIKREKQMMRDEAHIIRGELSQALYNEDLRKRLVGEIRRREEESERRQSTSQGEDDVYKPLSSNEDYCVTSQNAVNMTAMGRLYLIVQNSVHALESGLT
ncbi:unnamed protein product [Angiostrongylus costaricensis]|uniref:Sin3 histone deacetylase corepressor complex component sds3 n=1 Tax=Angiostrongylus costaricensis TaxID=334426 RepID=A0A158PKD9_ANGCS|nr:unnamed protein product [Angiostrongylus costaricensis]